MVTISTISYRFVFMKLIVTSLLIIIIDLMLNIDLVLILFDIDYGLIGLIVHLIAITFHFD